MLRKLNKEEKAAILCFRRHERFDESYNINNELNLLLLDFYDVEKLHKDGLIKYYDKLKETVRNEYKIGLILYGSIIEDKNNKLISIYHTKDNNKVELYTRTLCLFLLNDFFTSSEIITLCKITPNFKIYYNSM